MLVGLVVSRRSCTQRMYLYLIKYQLPLEEKIEHIEYMFRGLG